MSKLSTRRGFTLIEILVVIAIIGILVSIVSVNFNQAREQSRDRVRMSDLKQLQLALTLYKSQYGRYPEMGCGVPNGGSVGGTWVGPGPMSGNPNSWGGYSCEEYISGLVPEFMAELPEDPIFEDIVDRGIIYSTDVDGTGYKVLLAPENIKVTSYEHEFARCPNQKCLDDGYTACTIGSAAFDTYAIYSPGAKCN